MALSLALISGCASTSDPYTPQSEDGFTYNKDQSFAMNVVDGSLGFHNGLQDSDIPENASTKVGAMDYAASGILGFMNDGLGGGLLSLLGTNYSNRKPLHTNYAIVYAPVKNKTKNEVLNAVSQIQQDLITAATTHRNLKFIGTENKKGTTYLKYSGDYCEISRELWGFDKKRECNFSHYDQPQLIKFSDITPSGESGLFAVLGVPSFFSHTYLNFKLDKKYYVLHPISVVSNGNRIPFIAHNGNAYLFLQPSSLKQASKGANQRVNDFITLDEMTKINPWVAKHYLAK